MQQQVAVDAAHFAQIGLVARGTADLREELLPCANLVGDGSELARQSKLKPQSSVVNVQMG